MMHKVGDICRVNQTHEYTIDNYSLVGSIVEVTVVHPLKFAHTTPVVSAKILFGPAYDINRTHMFYADELDIITQEPHNDAQGRGHL